MSDRVHYGGYTTGDDPHWPEYHAWLVSLGWPKSHEPRPVPPEVYAFVKAYDWKPSQRCKHYPLCSLCKGVR